MRILSIETSTSAAKVLLYDTVACTTQMAGAAYPPQLSRTDGSQDAEGIYRLAAGMARELCAGREVDIIALVGAWHGIMLCDRDGRPATSLSNWEDTRAAALCARLRRDEAFVRDYYRRTGCMVNATYPFFRLLYLKRQGYDLSRYAAMGQGSYNTFRLTGARVTTDCMASGSGLLNIHSRTYDDLVLRMLGVGADAFSRPVHFDQLQRLSAAGAGDLGLKSGIPVIPVCSDGGMNQIAVGGYREGVMSFSVGTSGALRLSVPEPVLPDLPAIWSYLSPVGPMSGGATAGACNCLNWFKERFLPDVDFASLEDVYRPDRDTPVFLPFLFGERCPGWDDARKGGFLNLTAAHDRMSMYQAVAEGILFNLYQCYLALAEANGAPRRVVLSGGILNSAGWTQMCADVFGLDMGIPDNPQSSLWGGAVLAAMHMLGVDAADGMVGSFRPLRHSEESHRVYMEKFERYLDGYR